jgi:hypothetical protein
MGILVPEAYLPMGVTVSNVYMSFSGEVIYTVPRSGQYNVNTYYKVYKDETKQPDTNIRIPISVLVSNIVGRDVYTILYDELKTLYPGSTDIITTFSLVDPSAEPEVLKRTIDETEFGSNVLARAEQYLLVNPTDYEFQNVYNIAEQNFYGDGIASTTEMNQILQLLNSNVSTSGSP